MIKYVVWGAGNRGTDVVNALKGRVVAFIDNNESNIGKRKRELPIISYDTYKKDYSQYIIIVTPDGYEKEIAIQLEQDGIFQYFLYQDGFCDVETFALQVNKKCLFHDLNKEDTQYIYGLTLMGLVLYEDLEERGFDVKLVLRPSDKGRYYQSFSKLLKIKISEIDGISHLHLSTEPEKEVIECKTTSYYNLIEQDIFENNKIHQFKNKYSGKRCFVIGTGPSLRMEDLDLLKSKKEICISMNGIYKAFEFTEWRPDFYMVADLDAVYFGLDNIINMNVPYKFVADIAWDEKLEEENVYKWHLVRRWVNGKEPQFSKDFSKCSYAGLTITYDGALQLAAYMGFSEIYLLGIDCNNYRDTGTAHFFDKYGLENKVETGKLNVDDNILAYISAEKFSRQNGFRIYNATRGGNLEVFERKDFDSLF